MIAAKLAVPAALLASASAVRDPRPLNVSYDARSLLFDGERRLWVSGGMHYSRHQPALWAPVLQQAKAAGLVGVTSYVMWNQHENVRGTYDWGQVQPRSNITRFLQTAHDTGLLVHLRLGPYIDGEWNYGGFPWWINQVDVTVGDNSAYEAEMKKWIGALVEHIRPFLASNGGPVILLQIENEFSDHSDAGVKYGSWAMEMAVGLDTGIPWTFCNNSGSATYTLPAGLISTANAGMGPATMITSRLCGQDSDSAYPGQPCLWTEIEEAFYQWSGGNDGGQAPAGLANQQLQWYALGGAGSNYYMWSGGTDYALSAGDDDTTSYHQYSCLEPVFDKPNEPKYSFLGALHKLLVAHQDVILGQAPPAATPLSADKSCFAHTYTNASLSLHFVANEGKAGKEVTIGGVKFFASAGTRLLVSSSASAAGLHAKAAPKMLFNSSAVGDNTNPPFQVETATASALRWSSWVEGTPSSYDAELVAAAGLDKLRSTGDSPTEQVEMELTLAGSQVTDYAWYSAEFAPPAAAVAEARAEGAPAPKDSSIAVFTCAASASWQLWTLVPIAKWSKKSALQSVDDAKLCVSITDDQFDGGNGTALVPCDEADPRQQWLTGLDGTHIEGAAHLCLDVQDASTADGANVFSYDCGTRPGGNQRWSVMPAEKKGQVTIVTKLDSKCLGAKGGNHSASEMTAELHESTLASVFLNSSYIALLDNQGHNGNNAAVSVGVAPDALPKPGSSVAVEVFSSTVGISADEASATVALAQSIEYLGLKSLNISGHAVAAPWAMQVGLLGEALRLPTAEGNAQVQWTELKSDSEKVGRLTWLKATFDAPSDWQAPEALALDLTGATKGHLYINGFDAGRYWVRDPVIATYYQLPPDNLKPTGNLLVLFEEVGAPGLSTVRVVRRKSA